MFKVAVLGNWGTALEILKILNTSKNISVEFVFTQYCEKGIGGSWCNVVYDYAKEYEIDVFEQKKNKKRLLSMLEMKNIDLLVSVAYPYLINKNILDYMENKRGVVNLHGSLLPKYRGTTPIPWAIIDNEKYIGMTLHYIDEGCDTGDIIYQDKIENKNEDSIDVISDKLKEKAKNMFTLFLDDINNNKLINRMPQDNSLACDAPRLKDSDLKLDFSRDFNSILSFYKGTRPYKIYLTYKNKKHFIKTISMTPNKTEVSINTIIDVYSQQKIVVASMDYDLILILESANSNMIDFVIGDKVNE
jgi:methionyl-tRNA formyltransferase